MFYPLDAFSPATLNGPVVSRDVRIGLRGSLGSRILSLGKPSQPEVRTILIDDKSS